MSILRTSKNLTNVRNGGTPVIIREGMLLLTAQLEADMDFLWGVRLLGSE